VAGTDCCHRTIAGSLQVLNVPIRLKVVKLFQYVLAVGEQSEALLAKPVYVSGLSTSRDRVLYLLHRR
jgi:hypothetical protein